MGKPQITVNGKDIELPVVKARLWKEVMRFHSERKDIPTTDLIERYCEIIAVAFGITTEEVLDNLNLEDVGETYYKVFNAVLSSLERKVPKKKETEGEATPQA